MIDVPVDNHTLLTLMRQCPIVTGYGGGPEVALMEPVNRMTLNPEMQRRYEAGAYLAVELTPDAIRTLAAGRAVYCYATSYDNSRTADLRLRKITAEEFRAELIKGMRSLPGEFRTDPDDELIRQMTDNVDI